jgi:hypothetical protein
MGGTVGVDSTPAGSTFWLTARLGKAAPLHAAPAGAEPPDVVLARDYAGVHVLLAEDEPINQ